MSLRSLSNPVAGNPSDDLSQGMNGTSTSEGSPAYARERVFIEGHDMQLNSWSMSGSGYRVKASLEGTSNRIFRFWRAGRSTGVLWIDLRLFSATTPSND